MTNKHASKQHGLHQVKVQQPKSSLRMRRNKQKANERRKARRELLPGK